MDKETAKQLDIATAEMVFGGLLMLVGGYFDTTFLGTMSMMGGQACLMFAVVAQLFRHKIIG